MRLRIIGKPRRMRDTAVFRRAVRFYLSQLMRPSSIEKLTITVKFVPKFECSEALGDVYWNQTNVRPKSFTIRFVEQATKREVLEGLAHELTHIKQYVTGELRDYSSDENAVNWKGKVFPHGEPEDDHYWTSPWEVEAYGRQEGLYRLFLKHERKSKK